MELSDAALERLREAVAAPDLAGTRYRITGRLGQGGMGTVYLALDTVLDREVALKVLSGVDPWGPVPGAAAAEARILARLEHPGIVPVHDAGVLPDGRAYMVMKRVRGKRLDRFWTGDRPLAEGVRLLIRLCDAVAFAHAHGVVHRDLKPSNVMVGEFGEVLVLDWGVARRARDAPEAPGTVRGTPGYMAPEQARGEEARIGPAADVYALGAVLRFLLADRAVPPPLAAVLSRALAPEPETRYADARALGEDLTRFLDDRAVLARREGPLERTARFVRRYRTPLLLVAAYLAMRVALILWGRR